MNEDRIKGEWKQVKGKVKEQWGKLTDDDLEVINGQWDQLIGKLQQRYGLARDQAEREADTFYKNLEREEEASAASDRS
ncbi:MAG TPA: CsbD family protein [Acidobacteriota bacterium]|nr:CsbD family protein [Acidobacteriota bacterium]